MLSQWIIIILYQITFKYSADPKLVPRFCPRFYSLLGAQQPGIQHFLCLSPLNNRAAEISFFWGGVVYWLKNWDGEKGEPWD